MLHGLTYKSSGIKYYQYGKDVKQPRIAVDNTETMAQLKKLLNERGMSQAELARELKKNKVTISRWSHNTREINLDNAIKIAKILKCDPSEVLFQQPTIQIKEWMGPDLNVRPIEGENEYGDMKVKIPSLLFKDNMKGIVTYAPGSHFHQLVWLFDVPKVAKQSGGFSDRAINQTCYLEPTEKAKKEKGCIPVVGVPIIVSTDFNAGQTTKVKIIHPKK